MEFTRTALRPLCGFTALHYASAPMDFELSDEQRLLRDTVRDFARQEVAPVAEELDRTKSFPY